MADRWTTLEQLNKLRQEGAITGEEYDAQKRDLLKERRSVPWVLIGSAIVLLIVLAPIAFWAASQHHAGQVAMPSGSDAAVIATPSVADSPASNLTADATGTAITPVLNADDLANAFGAVFGSAPSEKLADGTSVTFRASRVVPLDTARAALISTAQGEACHACQGYLRVDYLSMTPDHKFAIAAPVVRSIISGSSWGEPPSYKIFIKPGALVALQAMSIYAGQGCVEQQKVTYKLADTGVVQAKSEPKEECTKEPPEAAPTSNTSTANSVS